MSLSMIKNGSNNAGSTDAKLSPRERECLYWISQGKTIEETAMILGIKYGTVVGYVRSLKEKMNCNTLAHLVFKAMKLEIIFFDKSNPQKVGE